MDQRIGRIHPAQYKFHTQVMIISKNPPSNSVTISMSTLGFDEGTKSVRSAVHWSSCARLCDVLSFTVHAAWSPAAFFGNGFTPLIRFNITGHTFLIVLIFGFFAGHKDIYCHTGKTFLAYHCCIRCCPSLYKGSPICQRMVINACLI